MGFLDDLSVFFTHKDDDGFCDNATYTPRGGSAGSSFLIYLDEIEEASNVYDNAGDNSFIRAQVQTADATSNSMTAKNHATRDDRDYVTINSVDFGIMGVQTDKHGITYLTLERNEFIKQ